MADVSTLYTALSGLYAARRGLDVAGQNVANANTEGYSRQRIVQESIGAPSVPAIWSQWNGGSGGGTRVSDVQRMRDAFLEARGQVGHAQIADLTTQQTITGQIEQLFPEPGENGLQNLLNTMWNGFDDVANNPGDLAARAQLLQQATSVTDWLHQTSTQLTSQQTSIFQDLQALASEVTAASKSLADLNRAILRGQQSELPVNELLDQRDTLAMKLAEMVGGTTRMDPDGTLGVYVSGAALVRGTTAEAIEAQPGPHGTGSLVWSRDGSALVVTGGSANAMLLALNDTTTGAGIPYWQAQLDGVAQHLADAVNALHTAGYDLDGNLGGDFFTDANGGTTVTAATIKVAITDPRLVAASSVGDPMTPSPNLDGGTAAAIAKLAADPTGPNSDYQTLIVNLGIAKQTVDRKVNTQNAIVTQVDDARESAAGVSLDEEMTNILAYQRAYEAASRVMTSVDQMLDVLINRTGLVGR